MKQKLPVRDIVFKRATIGESVVRLRGVLKEGRSNKEVCLRDNSTLNAVETTSKLHGIDDE